MGQRLIPVDELERFLRDHVDPARPRPARRSAGRRSGLPDPDGSLTLYIQHECPGVDLEPNWIPAPAGAFLAGMRLYGPSQDVQHDRWQLPPLAKWREKNTS